MFEKEGKIFSNHVKFTHQIWDYANFVIYLNIIGNDNCTGIESYIIQKLKQKELDWFPIEQTADLLKNSWS